MNGILILIIIFCFTLGIGVHYFTPDSKPKKKRNKFSEPKNS